MCAGLVYYTYRRLGKIAPIHGWAAIGAARRLYESIRSMIVAVPMPIPMHIDWSP
jgi:hypothetical protein